MPGQDSTTIRVEANGIGFEVATMGRGDRLALCLHGFPEHAFSWRYQMPLLAELGYRVWAPNLRGYGNTDAPRGAAAYATQTLVQDVAALIAAAAPRECLLLGHDWGGLLAWRLAMEHPSLLQRLVIFNVPHPACFARELRHPAQWLRSWYMFFFQVPVLPEALMGIGGCRFFAKTIRRTSRDPDRFPDDVIEVYRRNAARPGRLTAMVNWYRGLLRGGGLRDGQTGRPRTIEAPTLLIWGDADAFFVPQVLEGTSDYVSDLTVRVLPGVSHWVQQEAPEAVNELLRSWLQGR